MTHPIQSIDCSMLQRAQRIAAVTLASLALGAPALLHAQPATPAGQQKAADQVAADACKRVDTNRDGKLSYDVAARLPAIAAKFDELDKFMDGSLSMDEFRAGYAIK